MKNMSISQKTSRASENAPAPSASAGLEGIAVSPPLYGIESLDSAQTGAVQMKTAGPALPNRTGLPDTLKSGVESLSGLSLDDVRVHYNSSKPAQLQALAYTQGADIHVAPGQERHLPHEAWHVVQQKQGRVKAITQLKGTALNNDNNLEKEAITMGMRALTGPYATTFITKDLDLATSQPHTPIIQRRKIGLFGMEAEVIKERFFMSGKIGTPAGDLLADTNVNLEEYEIGTIQNKIDVTLDNEVIKNIDNSVYRAYTVEFIQKPVDVIEGERKEVLATASAWRDALTFWRTNLEGETPIFGRDAPLVDYFMENLFWEGGQFETHQKNPAVVSTDEEHYLDWTDPTLNAQIRAKTDDPDLSIQLTAGATLTALENVYKATSKILLTGQGLTLEEEFDMLTSPPENESQQASREVIALIKLIGSYLSSTRPLPTKTKRYAKEYLSLMSRTSLDAVFGSMNGIAQKKFKILVTQYLYDVDKNLLLKTLKLPPSAQVFAKTASKENEATDITIEAMLLSIIKMKRSELDPKLVSDPEAPRGDIFSQTGLAGISEINPNNPEMLTKFHIGEVDEMMNGIKGIIFENRAAQVRKLSEMPDIFTLLAQTLTTVESLL